MCASYAPLTTNVLGRLVKVLPMKNGVLPTFRSGNFNSFYLHYMREDKTMLKTWRSKFTEENALSRNAVNGQPPRQRRRHLSGKSRKEHRALPRITAPYSPSQALLPEDLHFQRILKGQSTALGDSSCYFYPANVLNFNHIRLMHFHQHRHSKIGSWPFDEPVCSAAPNLAFWARQGLLLELILIKGHFSITSIQSLR